MIPVPGESFVHEEAEERARQEAEERARQEAEERARQEAEERARIQEEVEKKSQLEILRKEEDRKKNEAEEKARRERRILELENESEDSSDEKVKVEISKAIIQPIYTEDAEDRSRTTPRSQKEIESPYRRDDNKSNQKEQQLLRQKYHGNNKLCYIFERLARRLIFI